MINFQKAGGKPSTLAKNNSNNSKHNMQNIQGVLHFGLTLLLAFLLSGVFNSCQDDDLPFLPAIKSSGLKEIKLGQSDYYLHLPESFKISEARGKEGQWGFNIIPTDTSSTMFGLIEIRSGNPIGGESEDKSAEKFALSYLAEKKVEWKIHQTKSGYFNAYTSENGDLNAKVSSKNRKDIDSVISIIATLKKK